MATKPPAAVPADAAGVVVHLGRGPTVPNDPDELLAPGVQAELASRVGPAEGRRLAERLAAAAAAYERDRYLDAFRITKTLADVVPDAPAVRELHGLVCYRLGRWRMAITHLQAAAALLGDDPRHLPVLMDCHRALGHLRPVQELWEALVAASPGADVVAEGRLVLAGAWADHGRLSDAIAVLVDGGAARDRRHPADRHVRQWYALADLAERAGDVGWARRLFTRVVAADPELADAVDRLELLGGPVVPVLDGHGSGDGHATLGAIAAARPLPVRAGRRTGARR